MSRSNSGGQLTSSYSSFGSAEVQPQAVNYSQPALSSYYDEKPKGSEEQSHLCILSEPRLD